MLFMPQYDCCAVTQKCCPLMGLLNQHPPPNSLTLEFRQDCQWSYTQGCDRLGVTIYLYFCK